MECHECHLFDSSGVAQLLTVHASAWLKSHPCFASPIHACPLNAYATLTGIIYARERLGEISIKHGSGADAGWSIVNHKRDS